MEYWGKEVLECWEKQKLSLTRGKYELQVHFTGQAEITGNTESTAKIFDRIYRSYRIFPQFPASGP
jgi:hypothetical protein